MKKLFVLMSLMLFLTTNAAKALTIDVQPALININGTAIYRSSIRRIDYSNMNGLTSIYLKDGNVLSFYTDYNEYSQIDRAYHTVTIAYQTYITPYYGYYPPVYPVMPQPIPQPQVNHYNYQTQGTSQVIYNGYNRSNVHQGGQTSYAVSAMPMAAATVTYRTGNFIPHHQGFPGGSVMMPHSRGCHAVVPMGT